MTFQSTAYTGLAVYGRVQAVIGFLCALLIGGLMMALGMYKLVAKKKPGEEQPSKGVYVSLMFIGLLSILGSGAYMYFAFRSKSFAAVSGGIGLVDDMIF